MFPFEKIVWIKQPTSHPVFYLVRFVGDDWQPPEDRGYAVISDSELIRRCRRAFRRDLRALVKQYGTIPRRVRQDPFWWTPKTTKLVVEEMRR